VTTARRKVAVIGGGCAAMTAAYELTRPELRDQFEVTVYQMGWRLGGKGASGRGAAGRIEEHGLHIWQGWYENAFRLMRDCYADLDRPPTAPLATWLDAFSPMEQLGVTDRLSDDEWSIWAAALPPMEGMPGDPLPEGFRWSVADYASHAVRLLLALLQTIDGAGPASPPAALPSEPTAEGWMRILRYGELASLAGVIHVVSMLGGLFQAASPVPQSVVLDVLDGVAANTRGLLESRIGGRVELRRVWHIIDVTIATLRGILRDGLMTDPRGFDAIDEYECRDWLRRNGATPASLDSGYLRALYDLAFCYEDGDPARPCMSAGQAIRGTLRMFFTYRGAFFWRMNAGMGDVVFAPMYEVLKRRGVHFEFFHALANVGLGEDSSPHVARLDFDVQARILGGGEYEPLVDIAGLPCWPSEPRYEQLAGGENLRSERPAYESPSRTPKVGTRTLEVGEDFDFVVLGIGLGAVPDVCRELVERDPRWKAMTERVKTVATQALQIWLDDDMPSLGWTSGPVALSGFVEPFDTWADMTHLIPVEGWSDPKPRALAYFCNVLPASVPDEDADQQVQRSAEEFLKHHIRHLWPRAARGDSFDWDRLVSPNGSDEQGPERLRTQFWRANIEPSDRYVQSVPGSAAYRISPLDHTYDNLTIAGDWTSCSFNAGCVEAAVMSGRLAAHALSGFPRLEDIIGFDHP
jgi:uncharacterized protein with NAD-binding domain and iron-sulfur cluster